MQIKYTAKLSRCRFRPTKCRYFPDTVSLKLRASVATAPIYAGSKNKPKTVTADFATQIAEKQSAKEALTAEIASITANIDTLKADLKVKKAALKKVEKEVEMLEAKKAKADAKAAEDAKKAEAESVLKKLLAEGMSADEILAKLK